MQAVRIKIIADEPIGTIRPELHGQFAEHLGACINDGLWVGEDSSIPNLAGIRTDVLDALRALRVPLLRWPGGCYADDYHWTDGIGPLKQRPRTVNLWWGSAIECNDFGTHEFMRLCQFLGAKPYLAGNVGSGSPREMREWMEYCNFAGGSTLARRRGENGSPMPFGVKYWGVGNEAWGCGGNFCPEDYAREYKRFATYLTGFGTEPCLVACGPDGNNTDWTRRFLTKYSSTPDHFNRRLDVLAAHYYCGTAGRSATQFDTNEWYELLYKASRIEQLILDQRAVMDEFDPDRKIGLAIDEWGTWHAPTPGATKLWQQNTLRDALAAAITLDAFNRQADKIVLANIAQVVNVLQAMVLTHDDQMLLTPTYHVFDLYQAHRNGSSLRVEIDSETVPFAMGQARQSLPALLGSASLNRVNPVITLSVVNCLANHPMEAVVTCTDQRSMVVTAHRAIAHQDLAAHNTFEFPDSVKPTNVSSPASISDGEVILTLPPASVSVIHFNGR